MQKKKTDPVSPTTVVPEIFEWRKLRILESLSSPGSDLSPKGSVDEGVRGLIDDINAQPGLVTTSSCAGRISVFLEGKKPLEQQQRQFVQSGGKGAGRWLYVSHEPVITTEREKTFHELFDLVPGAGGIGRLISRKGPAPRLVHFRFEPLVRMIFLPYILFLLWSKKKKKEKKKKRTL